MVGVGSRTQQRQRLDGRAGSPCKNVAQLERVVLNALLREEIVEGLRNMSDCLRVGSDESRQFALNGGGGVHRVQAFRQEDGEGRGDVPGGADVVLPLLLRLLQTNIFFQKLHCIGILTKIEKKLATA